MTSSRVAGRFAFFILSVSSVAALVPCEALGQNAAKQWVLRTEWDCTENYSQEPTLEYFDSKEAAQAEIERTRKAYAKGAGVLQYAPCKPSRFSIWKEGEEAQASPVVADLPFEVKPIEIPKSIRAEDVKPKKRVARLEVLKGGEWQLQPNMDQVVETDTAKFEETVSRWKKAVDSENARLRKLSPNRPDVVQFRIAVGEAGDTPSKPVTPPKPTGPTAPFKIEHRTRYDGYEWNAWGAGALHVYADGEAIIYKGEQLPSVGKAREIIQRKIADDRELERLSPNALHSDWEFRIIDANGAAVP